MLSAARGAAPSVLVHDDDDNDVDDDTYGTRFRNGLSWSRWRTRVPYTTNVLHALPHCAILHTYHRHRVQVHTHTHTHTSATPRRILSHSQLPRLLFFCFPFTLARRDSLADLLTRMKPNIADISDETHSALCALTFLFSLRRPYHSLFSSSSSPSTTHHHTRKRLSLATIPIDLTDLFVSLASFSSFFCHFFISLSSAAA